MNLKWFQNVWAKEKYFGYWSKVPQKFTIIPTRTEEKKKSIVLPLLQGKQASLLLQGKQVLSPHSVGAG